MKICLIGLGDIVKNFLPGLDAARDFSLKAVCDPAEDAPCRDLFEDYHIYTDYQSMITTEWPHLVIVSTPADTQMEIAVYAMEHKTGVLLVPPTLSKPDELEQLIRLAQEKDVFFDVLLPWQHASTLDAFREHYEPEQIQDIRVTIREPYATSGRIHPTRLELGGAWHSSGIHAISMIATWLAPENISVTSVEKELCPQSGLPIYVQTQLDWNGIPVEITVDWRQYGAIQQTELTYEDRQLLIDHDTQSIDDEGDYIECGYMDAAIQQYHQYFTTFEEESHAQEAIRIFRILSAVDEKM